MFWLTANVTALSYKRFEHFVLASETSGYSNKQ